MKPYGVGCWVVDYGEDGTPVRMYWDPDRLEQPMGVNARNRRAREPMRACRSCEVMMPARLLEGGLCEQCRMGDMAPRACH